jgi:hypothetical protein
MREVQSIRIGGILLQNTGMRTLNNGAFVQATSSGCIGIQRLSSGALGGCTNRIANALFRRLPGERH